MISFVTNFAATGCSRFLGFPTWYEYLSGTCANPKITSINDVWLIVAAIIEILLRIAGMAAVALIIFAGFQYITSEAEPDTVNKARKTIINALVGLAISILAATIVNFTAGSIN
jgi:hypothetical protein